MNNAVAQQEEPQGILTNAIFRALALPEVFGEVFVTSFILRDLFLALRAKGILTDEETKKIVDSVGESYAKVVEIFQDTFKNDKEQEIVDRMSEAGAIYLKKFKDKYWGK